MRALFLVLVIALNTTACRKKVISEGTVYSPHNYPVANVTVAIAEYTTGKDAPLLYESTKTDEEGKFRFNYTAAKNRYFSIDVSCDSGFCHKANLSRDQLRTIDLQLQK